MHLPESNAWTRLSHHVTEEVRQHKEHGQKALFSLCSRKAGEVIADFSAGTISAEPTYLTVQLAEGKHITLQPEYLQYINHSCEPNVFFDTTAMQLVALKDIQPETELVFFYPSSEWDMTQSFCCLCGTASCLGEIRGAAHLGTETLASYRLTDYIRQRLRKKSAKKVA